MGSHPRIAVLIDAENASAETIDLVLATLRPRGRVTLARAYGNWQMPSLKPWTAALTAHGIGAVVQRRYVPGKNASDMAITVAAMDLLRDGSVDAIAVVSSDSDFTPVVERLRQGGLTVYGFGEKKTPKAFVEACSTFFHVEQLTLPAQPVRRPQRRTTPAELQQDHELVRALREAVASVADEHGWASLTLVAQRIAGGPADRRRHGYARLASMIAATGLFDLTRKRRKVRVRSKAVAA